jgi:hypothetical protein
MLGLNTKTAPIRAKLLISMMFDGEEHAAGDIVELSPHDFKYNKHLNRVVEYIAPGAKK